jgi:CRISPR type III-B/RAMP module RAMP protein Cmr6
VIGRDRDEIEEMFGPEEIIPGIGGAYCGDMIFHDGLPAKWPELCVDVINCHHPLYYTESSGNPESILRLPLETDNPVPVFFLAVEKGTKFIFRFNSRSSSARNIEKTSEILKAGLDLFGIGGKTAIGYGHFEHNVL